MSQVKNRKKTSFNFFNKVLFFKDIIRTEGSILSFPRLLNLNINMIPALRLGDSEARAELDFSQLEKLLSIEIWSVLSKQTNCQSLKNKVNSLTVPRGIFVTIYIINSNSHRFEGSWVLFKLTWRQESETFQHSKRLCYMLYAT